MKSLTQTAQIIFFWDNVIARSHIALTIHLTWPHSSFFHCLIITRVKKRLKRVKKKCKRYNGYNVK